LAASPGCMSVHWMVVESVLPIGAKSPVTRPSERYGSHAGLLSRMHVGEQDVSPSGCPLGLWQYWSWAVTHCSALAMTVERVTGPDRAAAAMDVRSGSEGRGASGGALAEQPARSRAAAGRVVPSRARVSMPFPYACGVPSKNPLQEAIASAAARVGARGARGRSRTTRACARSRRVA
jgi:hypothetical protein